MLKGVNAPWTEGFELEEILFTDQANRLIESGYRLREPRCSGSMTITAGR